MQLSRQADRRVQSARHEREQSMRIRPAYQEKWARASPTKAQGSRETRSRRNTPTTATAAQGWIVPASSSTVMKSQERPTVSVTITSACDYWREQISIKWPRTRTSVEMIEKHHAIHLKNTLDASAINDRATRRISSTRWAPRRNPTAKRAPHAAREDNIRLGLSNK